MIEHEELMKLKEHEDDVPVSFSIVPNGKEIDWRDNIPDEILYIPEEAFNRLAKEFGQTITPEEYYGQKVLDEKLETILLASLSKNTSSDSDANIYQTIYKFLNYAHSKKESHFVLYEGP